MKPDGCRCAGEEHTNPRCFITPAEHPTVGDLLRKLGLLRYGDADQAVRAALVELKFRREKAGL